MTQLSQRPTEKHDSFDSSYFSPLFEAEEHHFWFRARNRIIATVINRISQGLPPGYRVIEIGCGNGNTLRTLERACPDGLVVGMDLFAQGLGYARTRTQSALVQADLHQPPFGEPFNIVGLFDVLEHLPDDQTALDSLNRLLTPGGSLVITVPAYQMLWSYFDEVSHHCRRYEKSELEDKLAQAGFRVEYATYFMASIFPLVWLKRKLATFLTRFRSGQPKRTHIQKLKAELKIVPVFNEILAAFLSWENKAVAHRCKLPFGTSLLVVARKL